MEDDESSVKYVSCHLQSMLKSEIHTLRQVDQLKIIDDLINFLENLKILFSDSAEKATILEETVVNQTSNNKFDFNEHKDLQDSNKNNYESNLKTCESKDVLQVEKSDIIQDTQDDLNFLQDVKPESHHNEENCDALELSNISHDDVQFDSTQSTQVSRVGDEVISYTTIENTLACDDSNVTGNGFIDEDDINTEIENYDNINLHSNKTQDGYECTLCQKLYRTFSNLKEHLQSSHNIGCTEELSCTHQGCTYKTFSSGQYRAHKSWHANNAALVCPVCKKEYLGGTKGLRNHMKIHSKNKDYKCNQCNKHFINLSRLNYHIQNVHGDFIHLCEICNKQFRSKPNLIRHQQVHKNDNGYMCPCCSFTTSFSSSLTSHVRTVHKIHNFTTGKVAKLVKKDIRRNSTPRDKVKSMQNIINEEGEQLCSAVSQARRRQLPVTLLRSNQVEKQHVNEQNPVISITNSVGQLVDAIVQIKESDSGDAELHVTMSSTT